MVNRTVITYPPDGVHLALQHTSTGRPYFTTGKVEIGITPPAPAPRDLGPNADWLQDLMRKPITDEMRQRYLQVDEQHRLLPILRDFLQWLRTKCGRTTTEKT